MNINVNIKPELITRLVEAIEQFVEDYATVHASELGIPKLPVDNKVGVTYYQSDREVYERELREKLEKESELL